MIADRTARRWWSRLADLPLGYRLMLMMSAVIAVTLVSTYLAVSSGGLSLLRQQLGESLHSQARIVAANSRAALVFRDLSAARENLASLETEPAVLRASLHDARGRPFAQYLREGREWPVVERPLQGEGYFFDGDYVVAYQKVELRGRHLGGVMLVAGQHQFRALIRRYALSIGLPFLAAFLAAFALVALAQRQVSAPLRRLTRLMAEVEESGDYGRRATIDRRDEVGTLAAGFNRMLDTIRARDHALAQHRINLEEEVALRTAELAESEQRFRQLAENVAEVFWLVELEDGRISYVSPVFETVWGESCEALYAEAGLWMARIHEEDRPEVERAYEAALRGGEPFIMEYRVVRRDGTVRWVTDGGFPVHDRQGRPVRLAGTARDITDHHEAEVRIKRSLAEKEVLLREIHHRVKNNMQVISSLLSMQSQYVEGEEIRRALEESRLRVRSMALVHEKLYQTTDLSSIDFADYLRGLAGKVVGAYAHGGVHIELRYDLEPLSLGLDVAVPCGLITNELISNAVKYAFPSGRAGSIRVELHRCEVEGLSGLELVVADDGVGLPEGFDLDRVASLGLRLVSQLTRHQLHGRVEFSGERGAEFRVWFPEER